MSLVETAVHKKSVFCYYNKLRGRKQKMFLTIKEEIEAKTYDPNLSLLSPLLDPPHFGKSLKASFSNCMLKSFDEKGCLSFLLRAMRKLVPKNDHVKNKDRQDPVAVLKISSTGVTDHLKEIGFISHTVTPETPKLTNNSKVGMHSNPIGLSVCSYRYIYMLNFDTNTKLSKITKFHLHNPIVKFETIASEIKVNSKCYFEGRVFIVVLKHLCHLLLQMIVN